MQAGYTIIIEGQGDSVKRFTELMKKMDKTKWLILGLSGMLLLVIALPTGGLSGDDANESIQDSLDGESKDIQAETYEKELIEKLEKTLGYMNGVGEVHVMVTFQDSGEQMVEKDITKSESSSEASQYQESTVYTEINGREPYVKQQKLPAVEGVLIIAQGGGNSAVKQNITEAVMALFSIEAHKIKIEKLET